MGGTNQTLQRGKVLLAGNGANNQQVTVPDGVTATALHKVEAWISPELRPDNLGMTISLFEVVFGQVDPREQRSKKQCKNGGGHQVTPKVCKLSAHGARMVPDASRLSNRSVWLGPVRVSAQTSRHGP